MVFLKSVIYNIAIKILWQMEKPCENSLQNQACKPNFAEFMKERGGEWPMGPPSIFSAVKKSWLNQRRPNRCSTEKTASTIREEDQKKQQHELKDKIDSLENVRILVGKQCKYFSIHCQENKLTLFLYDKLSRKIE